MQEFNWFSPLLQECGDDMKGLEINTYMTGELDLVRTHRHTSLGTHLLHLSSAVEDETIRGPQTATLLTY